MSPSEIKAECERIWREQDVAYSCHRTRWEITTQGKFYSRKGKRYTLKRKSKYLGYGRDYLTPYGYELLRNLRGGIT